MRKIFIDGQHGTVGLQIIERIKMRKDVELIEIDPTLRRDITERKKLLNKADIVILCLPDQAAVEAVKLIDNENTRIIDASTAHRTHNRWIYGLPEIKGQRELIKQAKYVSNPGCYPTGFIILVKPLVDNGVISKDYPAAVYAVTGYSGGGKSMIKEYESKESGLHEEYACRPKNLTLGHRHIPEMWKYSGLKYPPVFLPIVGDYYNGMLVFVPLQMKVFTHEYSGKVIHEILSEYYKDEKFVDIMALNSDSELKNGFLTPIGTNNTNNLELFVYENDNQVLLVARLDNLGKGASGAAVQNMNIMLGINENEGLK